MDNAQTSFMTPFDLIIAWSVCHWTTYEINCSEVKSNGSVYMEDLMTAYLYLLICLVFDGLHV